MKNKAIVDISDNQFSGEVLESEVPVLVDFWAPWCSPCRMIGPVIDGLAGEYDGRVKVAKMNVDENLEVPSRYSVRTIPTMIVFKDGKVFDRVLGAVPPSRIKSVLDSALAAKN